MTTLPYRGRYNRRSIVTITPPTGDAVSTADMKTYLRVDHSDDDTLIADFVDTATEAAKQYTRQALLTEVLELRMDGFPGDDDERIVMMGAGMHDAHYRTVLGGVGEIDLPFTPIQSLDSITTYDRSNSSSVLTSAAYSTDLEGGRVYLNDGYTWPTDLRDRDAVYVRYTAGYGAGSIPTPIVQAIRQHVEAMYECRGGCAMPEGCKALLTPYKRYDQLGWF